jgi:hypothetical protein
MKNRHYAQNPSFIAFRGRKASIQINMDPYPQLEVLDFVRLMKDFLDRRIDVRQYTRSYFDLSKKRFVATPEEDKILQQAYGDADDFDDVVHLEYTINEEQLRGRVSTSLERFKALGHAIAGS